MQWKIIALREGELSSFQAHSTKSFIVFHNNKNTNKKQISSSFYETLTAEKKCQIQFNETFNRDFSTRFHALLSPFSSSAQLSSSFSTWKNIIEDFSIYISYFYFFVRLHFAELTKSAQYNFIFIIFSDQVKLQFAVTIVSCASFFEAIHDGWKSY